MAERRIGIIVNGATGRMGYRQHLVRSLLAIQEQGGVELAGGDRLLPDLLLVGRNEEKLRGVAEKHGLTKWTTDVDEALANPDYEVYFDALVTNLRVENLKKAIAAGKAIYTEKPTAESFEDALELARLAKEHGTVNGVVHDKLYLPGLLKLRRLIDSGFFGEILSVRGEFGYWVYEGDWQPAQRPSWNYRSEDGGGIATDGALTLNSSSPKASNSGIIRGSAAASPHIPTGIPACFAAWITIWMLRSTAGCSGS